MRAKKSIISPLGVLAVAVLLILATPAAFAGKGGNKGGGGGGGGGNDGGGGRLSPASLDMDTCGCPSTFTEPECREEYYWSLTKSVDDTEFNNEDDTGYANPSNQVYSFDVTVTQDGSETYLRGGGQIVITNSGDTPTDLTSLALSLETQHVGGGQGDAPGPSGRNWDVLATAVQNRAEACGGTAVTCYGNLGDDQDDDNALILFTGGNNDLVALNDVPTIQPTIDNDGDGLRDEDPVYTGANDTALSCSIIDNDGDGLFDEDPIDGLDNDGDGLIDEDDPDDDGDGLTDEDGACTESFVINFQYSFRVTSLGIVEGDALRLNLMSTFVAGGGRGGTCEADTDCDGTAETDVRTVQQRLEFSAPACIPACNEVTLTDAGASQVSGGPDCLDLSSDSLAEDFYAVPLGSNDASPGALEPGESAVRTVSGEVSCNVSCPEGASTDDIQRELEDAEGDDGIVHMVTAHPGGDSYFNTTISGSEVESLNGTYDGWCVDTDRNISPGGNYCARLVSSYDGEIEELVEQPENFDLVNWVINQHFVGEPSGCGGNYTFGDVQRAIWDLIENGQSTAGLGSWAQCRVDEIVNAAQASGNGFIPSCSQEVAIILVPVNCDGGGSPNAQITIAQITMIEHQNWCGFLPGCGPCEATVGNTATLDCADGADSAEFVEGSPASAAFEVFCGGFGPVMGGTIDPGDFCGQTQGGWGTTANGNNPGALRDLYFGVVFPDGLVVGDADGPDADNSHALLLQDAAAVEAYLPAGSTAAALTADQTNPEMTSAGVFGGQLVAATLNVGFDDEGYGLCTLAGDCTFEYEPGTLRTLVYDGECVADGLGGVTVDQLLQWSNCAISGADLAGCGVPEGVTIPNLSAALALLNEGFVSCEGVSDCLLLP